ncbi:MAG: ABC transporter ATP-binding protein, partial [Fimbriimonadaceae bacterium]|nr:ABC transporter ATP-binding protein [Alphaproteobacteria bacterium]
LEIKNLAVSYGPFMAVENLSFDIRPGEIFALLGANGAGKTSTIMAIAGHAHVSNGSVVLDGKDVTTLPVHERVAHGIALVPEGRRLFPDLDVRENLAMGAYTHSRGDAARGEERVFALFPRLKERVGQLAGTLSGGEQQMVAMGRALMAGPKVLMVDEVSLGLMPKVVDICYDAIRTLCDQGIAILLVDQNTTRAIDAANRICVLESGSVVWSGDATAARADTSMIDAFLGLHAE